MNNFSQTHEKLRLIRELKRAGCSRNEAKGLFLQRFSDAEYEFFALWHEDASTESTTSLADEAPSESTLEGGALFYIKEACLPKDVVLGESKTCLIPAELSAMAYMFSVKSRARHVVATDERLVTVGSLEHPSLRTAHLRVFMALFWELQKRNMPYRHVGVGEDFLELDISIYELHQTLTPRACYGGASKARILAWLDAMVQTPVRIEHVRTGAIAHTTLLASCDPSPAQGKYRLRLAPHWTRPFLLARGTEGSKAKLKPFLWGEFEKLRSPYARPTYLHLDWALSHNHKAELQFETILRRAGTMDDEKLGEGVLYTSQQRDRLCSAIAELEGIKLSSGDTLFVHEASVKTNRPGQIKLKLVAAKKRYNEVGDYGATAYCMSIQSVEYYRDPHARALTLKKSRGKAEILAAV